MNAAISLPQSQPDRVGSSVYAYSMDLLPALQKQLVAAGARICAWAAFPPHIRIEISPDLLGEVASMRQVSGLDTEVREFRAN